MAEAKRPYTKRKRNINPVLITFLSKRNGERRSIRCHRVDEQELAWAVHQKIADPERNYVRHITEWFEKSMWEHHIPVPRRGQAARAKIVEKSFEPPRRMKPPVDEAPRPKVESPKNPPPPITFDVDDDDDTLEIPAKPEPVKKAAAIDPLDPNVELPTEYNPRAHKELAAGAPEDLVVFDAMVDANFIAQQRRNKLASMRAQREGRFPRPSQNNPIVSGFEPG